MSIRSIRVSHIVLSTEELAKTLLDHLGDDEYKDKDMLYKMFAKMAKNIVPVELEIKAAI